MAPRIRLTRVQRFMRGDAWRAATDRRRDRWPVSPPSGPVPADRDPGRPADVEVGGGASAATSGLSLNQLSRPNASVRFCAWPIWSLVIKCRLPITSRRRSMPSSSRCARQADRHRAGLFTEIGIASDVPAQVAGPFQLRGLLSSRPTTVQPPLSAVSASPRLFQERWRLPAPAAAALWGSR